MRLRPKVRLPPAGRLHQADDDERQHERARVGEHVRRVGEQRERVGEDPDDDLGGHEPGDQAERDPQPPGVGVRLDSRASAPRGRPRLDCCRANCAHMLDPGSPGRRRAAPSPRGAASASPTWTRTAACGSTRSPGSSRTSRSTTSRRPAGACRSTCGSCAASGSTSSSPFLGDREVELTTWCSGVAAIAAGRRWSVRGDAGGELEVDSVWIHLDAEANPARIEDFGVYAEATQGRHVSTKLELPDPPADAPRSPWTLRATDVDLHGHVNNAVYWQAVEELFGDVLDGPRAGGARLPAADRPRRGDRARPVRRRGRVRRGRRGPGRRPRLVG